MNYKKILDYATRVIDHSKAGIDLIEGDLDPEFLKIIIDGVILKFQTLSWNLDRLMAEGDQPPRGSGTWLSEKIWHEKNLIKVSLTAGKNIAVLIKTLGETGPPFGTLPGIDIIDVDEMFSQCVTFTFSKDLTHANCESFVAICERWSADTPVIYTVPVKRKGKKDGL